MVEEPAREFVEYQAGDVLIREGQVGRNLFVLMNGRLEVLHDDVHIAEITQKGSFLGEISSILGCRCTATVRAAAPSKLLVIRNVTNYLEENPKSAIVIAQTLASRIMDMNDKFTELQRSMDEMSSKLGFDKEAFVAFNKQLDQIQHKPPPPLPNSEAD